MMNERTFQAMVFCTKIIKKMENDFPKMIGAEFNFEDFRVSVCSSIISIENCNDGNCYVISTFPSKNKKEIPKNVVNVLNHLYDFLKS